LPSPSHNGPDTFASVLQQGLGNTICNEFYFPYAKKIWGLAPEELSAIQAHRRVSSGSIGKMIRRLLPGGGSGGASTKGIFYYPRKGFGQISTALHEAAVAVGADVRLNTRIVSVSLNGEKPVVVVESQDGRHEFAADQVYSTIPVTILTRLLAESPPAEVSRAAEGLEFRSMVLVYLTLDTGRFTEYDAHYFPGAELPFTRLSETRNYSTQVEPKDRTVLCVEVPCFQGDSTWEMSDADLRDRVSDGLRMAGLPITCDITGVVTRRIPFAYPLYRDNYEQYYTVLDNWVESLDGLLSFGRQGLFAHDNTHHAMFMANAAVACLRSDGTIDREAWRASRKIFETHVVED
jgi:protoporphyrinogen oxidase